MHSWIFIVWIMIPVSLGAVYFLDAFKRKKIISAYFSYKKTNKKGEKREEMIKLINDLFGKKCHISTIDNKDYFGIIESSEENWISIHDLKQDNNILVNIEYITGIVPYKEKEKKEKANKDKEQ